MIYKPGDLVIHYDEDNAWFRTYLHAKPGTGGHIPIKIVDLNNELAEIYEIVHETRIELYFLKFRAYYYVYSDASTITKVNP